jgi:RHS repeat-associated protein
VVDGVTTIYSYDAANRLINETRNGQSTTYNYDNNGNLIARTAPDGITRFSYTDDNQLSGLTLADGSSWSFGYSPDGTRVYQQFTPAGGSAQRTDFLPVGDTVLTDYATNGAITHYLLGPQTDELFGQEIAGQWTYYIQDDLGTVSVATDATGQIVARRTYDVFGAVLEESNPWPGRYSFTGREQIGASGLLYYRARTYDSATGRFTSEDPVFGELALPETLHPYTYVKNDPVNLTDPSGEAYSLTNFAEFLLFTLPVEGGKQFLQSCIHEACRIGLAVVYVYEIYFAYVASFMDLVFTYGGLPESYCAIYFITYAWPLVAALALNALREHNLHHGYRIKPLEGVDAFIALLTSRLILAAGVEVAKLIYGTKYSKLAYKAVFEGLKYYYGIANTYKLGVGLAKLILAPEVAIGLCALGRKVGLIT